MINHDVVTLPKAVILDFYEVYGKEDAVKFLLEIAENMIRDIIREQEIKCQRHAPVQE